MFDFSAQSTTDVVSGGQGQGGLLVGSWEVISPHQRPEHEEALHWLTMPVGQGTPSLPLTLSQYTQQG